MSAVSGMAGGRWRRVTTIGGVGDLPFAPASTASALGAVLDLAMQRRLGRGVRVAIWVAIGALAVATTRVHSHGGDARGEADPTYVVIDEVVGQGVASLLAPPGLLGAFAALVCFRLLDRSKPGPILAAERVPVVGVVLDDVVAGAAAGLAVRLVAAIIRPTARRLRTRGT